MTHRYRPRAPAIPRSVLTTPVIVWAVSTGLHGWYHSKPRAMPARSPLAIPTLPQSIPTGGWTVPTPTKISLMYFSSAAFVNYSCNFQQPWNRSVDIQVHIPIRYTVFNFVAISTMMSTVSRSIVCSCRTYKYHMQVALNKARNAAVACDPN
jgi:hypothetical protein